VGVTCPRLPRDGGRALRRRAWCIIARTRRRPRHRDFPFPFGLMSGCTFVYITELERRGWPLTLGIASASLFTLAGDSAYSPPSWKGSSTRTAPRHTTFVSKRHRIDTSPLLHQPLPSTNTKLITHYSRDNLNPPTQRHSNPHDEDTGTRKRPVASLTRPTREHTSSVPSINVPVLCIAQPPPSNPSRNSDLTSSQRARHVRRGK